MKNTLISSNTFFKNAGSCLKNNTTKLVEAAALGSAYVTVNTANMFCADDPWFSDPTTTTISPPTSVGTIMAKTINFAGNVSRIVGVLVAVGSFLFFMKAMGEDNASGQSKSAWGFAVAAGFFFGPSILMSLFT